ncbi:MULTISPECIES: response regulator [Chitinophagaceae]
MEDIHVAIVDDSTALRESIVEGLKLDASIKSIQEFGSVEDFLWKEKVVQEPNILLLDVNLPRLKGIDAIDAILLKYPEINILMFSVYADSQTIFRAVSKGAVGYIQKSQQKVEDVLAAIKIVNNGGSYLSPTVTRQVLNLFHPSRITKLKTSLTQREEQVLNGLMKGLTYQQIADDLVLSIDTIRTYVKKIYGKLSVKNRTQLISIVHNIFHSFR